MNKKLKSYLVALGCAVISLASLAFTEFISLEALIGCSIIAACFLWIAVYGSGSAVSIGCAMLITAVATITWENPNCHTFTGKLLSATGYGVIMTAAAVIGILAVKELFNTLRMYYRRK